MPSHLTLKRSKHIRFSSDNLLHQLIVCAALVFPSVDLRKEAHPAIMPVLYLIQKRTGHFLSALEYLDSKQVKTIVTLLSSTHLDIIFPKAYRVEQILYACDNLFSYHGGKYRKNLSVLNNTIEILSSIHPGEKKLATIKRLLDKIKKRTRKISKRVQHKRDKELLLLAEKSYIIIPISITIVFFTSPTLKDMSINFSIILAGYILCLLIYTKILSDQSNKRLKKNLKSYKKISHRLQSDIRYHHLEQRVPNSHSTISSSLLSFRMPTNDHRSIERRKPLP